MAAGLTYFAFLSLPPLALLIISLASIILGDVATARAFLNGIASNAFPAQAVNHANAVDLTDTLNTIMQTRGTVGFIGLIGLLIGGTAFFRMTEYAVNGMWETERPRKFLARALVCVALTFSTVLLAGGSFAGTFMYHWASNWFELPASAQVAAWFAGVACAVVGLYVVYAWLTVAPLPRKAIVITSLVVIAVLEVLKSTFSLYVDRFTSYGTMYGPIGGVAMALVYMYAVLLVFLIGAAALAEIDSVHRREPSPRRVGRHLPPR
jgi:membrane protein